MVASFTGKNGCGRSFVTRRCLLRAGVAGIVIMSAEGPVPAQSSPRLLTAELRVDGDWKGAPIEAVKRVCEVVRQACFAGYRLEGDGQPSALLVRGQPAGPPAVWLHSDHPEQATVLVDVGQAAWMQLAYQMGHELGHVLANSWRAGATPGGPCQWIEESIAEAFSLANLVQLGRRWKDSPPFTGDAAYGAGIEDYAGRALAEYEGQSAPRNKLEAWLREQRGKRTIYESGGKKWNEGLVVWLATGFMADRSWMADINAMNRWPERAAIALPAYMDRWQAACEPLGTSGVMPARLKELLL